MKNAFLLGLAVVAQASVVQASNINDTDTTNDSVQRYLDAKRGHIKDNPWAVSLGVVGGANLYKGQKHNVSPDLNFGYYGEDLQVDFGGANYRFLGGNEDIVNLSGYVTFSGNSYEAKDSDYLKGMAKRDISADFGVNADFQLPQGTISTYAQHDVSGTYKGYQAGFNYTYLMMIDTVAFVPFTGVSYMDKNYVDYYFGVKNKEATANRKTYSGTGDFAYNVGYALAIPLSDNWDLTQTATYTRLGSKVSDSPIVDSANQWSIGASVAYHF